jgi:hypothetical protein
VWISTIDVAANELPDDEQIRTSDDPTVIRGANIYWDQPLLVAAHEVAKRSGCRCYSESAESAVKSYLHLTRAPDAKAFRLGNEQYFDVRTEQMKDTGLGKSRYLSHTPAWALFWQQDPMATSAAIIQRATSENSVSASSFHSLCWLSVQDDPIAVDAKRMVTMLARVIEADLADQTSTPQSMASYAKSLKHGAKLMSDQQLDLVANRVALRCQSMPLGDLDLIEQFTVLFDLQETALAGREGPVDAAQCVKRAERVRHSLKQLDREKLVARDYGKLVRFFELSARRLADDSYHQTAASLVDEAIDTFYIANSGMFRSRQLRSGPRDHELCCAADGIGWLLLALLQLSGSDTTQPSALQF